MKAIEYFTKENGYVHTGSKFKEIFGDVLIGPAVPLTYHTLSTTLTDQQIMDIYDPRPVTLGSLAEAVKGIVGSDWYIFYVNDASGHLWAINVYWIPGGWRINAGEIDTSDEWPVDSRVFSNKYLD